MSDSADQENQELITALRLFTISNTCEIVGVALLAYDHLLTFSDEVHFVWGRKFSGATVVFVLNRYVTLFSKIVLPISTFWWPNQTDKVSTLNMTGGVMCLKACRSCAAPVILTEIFTVVAYFVVAVFSALRVYAIWDKDWRPLLLVLIIALSVPVTNMYHYIQSIPQAFLYPLYGCAESTTLDEDQLDAYAESSYLVFASKCSSSFIFRLSLATHTCAIAADLLVLVLTWIKTYEVKKLAAVLRTDASFSYLLLRDGTLYFGTMLILNAVDLIVLRSDVIFNPLPIFIDVFTCILISRFMLNLREVAGRASGSGLSTSEVSSRISTVRFSPDIVGDLGAPLGHGEWVGTTLNVDALSTVNSTHLGDDVKDTDPRVWEATVRKPLETGMFDVEDQVLELQAAVSSCRST
ncbi:hypothetical protein BV20DRAFT_1056178 [Pilatotrama ljubarskyi]|nr:hypothetical protein BV20DRAFT_1056178 [Pilatotrama ljubarskyi]